MNIKDKASVFHKVDRKWVKEEKRVFTEYPGLPGIDFLGEQETWLELAQFYVEDLRWLLSLDHQKFWSHMIYSDKAHELLVTFLKGSPPKYVKSSLLIQDDIKNIFKEMEHLVFLVFLRLSTEKESETCYMKNLGEIIYNNYLFTVPIILDICLIYGTSNGGLVKKMINDVITLAPYFLDDFQEIIPYFIQVLRAVREKFALKHPPKLKEEADVRPYGANDVIFYLYDSVATIQRFFELYSNVCRFFSKGELVMELVSFYSNVLPDIEKHYSSGKGSSLMCDLVKNIRIDMLKIVKSIFDFISNETNEILEKTETTDEYLALMTELVSEPIFFFDYNLIYSVEFELEHAVRNCQNFDTVKLNHVLSSVASLISYDMSVPKKNLSPNEHDVKLKSLIMEVKGIFPHLTEAFIGQCLKHYDHNAERVITAVLENSISSSITLNEGNAENSEAEELIEFKGKHKSKHRNLSEMLDDRAEINAIKERCVQLSYVADETYDDEYDDTYDENIDVSVKEDEMDRRPFVIPKVLRRLKEEEDEEEREDDDGDDGNDDDDDDYDDDDGDGDDGDDDDDDDDNDNDKGEGKGVDGLKERSRGSNYFMENPVLARQRLQQARGEGGHRDVANRGRGQSQNRQVMRNRGFKESHKSFIANHNRKKKANRKMSQGMYPLNSGSCMK